MEGVPQGSVLGPFGLENHLENDKESTAQFFADDTSVYSIFPDPPVSAEELNHDFSLISKWANQCLPVFNIFYISFNFTADFFFYGYYLF